MDNHQKKVMTIWLTGLSASGKSTLANAIEDHLSNLGHLCCVLDGDALRAGLNRDLGYSEDDRKENIRRVAELAKIMNEAGLMVICALISPLISDRKMAKEIIGAGCFKEVYVSTPLAVCEARDPKGLYVKARSGHLPNFTGISASYEAPLSSDLIIDTSKESIDESLNKIKLLIH